MRRYVSEFIATAFLLTAVVGSGIMAERLSGGNVAVALLANTLATGAALMALILTFAPVSGAHMNPVVSLMSAINHELAWRDAAGYWAVQFAGAVAGVGVANVMFDLPVFFASQKVRTGAGQWIGEFVATFGLVGVIVAVSRRHKALPTALAVAAWITAAYWFTSSTSFANPAVTVARMLSDTFAGIRPADAPVFIIVQVVAGIVATFVFAWLVPVGGKMMEKKRVLLLCTGNSARSQMAEGLLRSTASDRFEVFSAGVAPSHVRAEAVEVMREIGIDISSHRSKSVDEFIDQRFDYIITVCDNAKESCPVFPGQSERIHWSFDDPAAVGGSKEDRLAAFRRARDQIHQKLTDFAEAGR